MRSTRMALCHPGPRPRSSLDRINWASGVSGEVKSTAREQYSRHTVPYRFNAIMASAPSLLPYSGGLLISIAQYEAVDSVRYIKFLVDLRALDLPCDWVYVKDVDSASERYIESAEASPLPRLSLTLLDSECNRIACPDDFSIVLPFQGHTTCSSRRTFSIYIKTGMEGNPRLWLHAVVHNANTAVYEDVMVCLGRVEAAVKRLPSEEYGELRTAQLMNVRHSGWIRDVTEEGVEPNPGPCTGCGGVVIGNGRYCSTCKGKSKSAKPLITRGVKKRQLMSKSLMSYEAIRDGAIDKVHAAARPAQPSPSSSSSSPPDTILDFPPHPDDSAGTARTGRRCYGCGTPGHTRRTCPTCNPLPGAVSAAGGAPHVGQPGIPPAAPLANAPQVGQAGLPPAANAPAAIPPVARRPPPGDAPEGLRSGDEDEAIRRRLQKAAPELYYYAESKEPDVLVFKVFSLLLVIYLAGTATFAGLWWHLGWDYRALAWAVTVPTWPYCMFCLVLLILRLFAGRPVIKHSVRLFLRHNARGAVRTWDEDQPDARTDANRQSDLRHANMKAAKYEYNRQYRFGEHEHYGRYKPGLSGRSYQRLVDLLCWLLGSTTSATHKVRGRVSIEMLMQCCNSHNFSVLNTEQMAAERINTTMRTKVTAPLNRASPICGDPVTMATTKVAFIVFMDNMRRTKHLPFPDCPVPHTAQN